MKATDFNIFTKRGIVENFGSDEFTFTDYDEQDWKGIIYNFEKGEFTSLDGLEFTQEQIKTLENIILDHYENLKPE